MTKLKELFGDRLRESEPLAKHLTFRVGGPAKWFVEVQSVGEIQQAMQICRDEGLSWEILGGGSNALANDAGYDGLIMKMGMKDMTVDDRTITVDAGMPSVVLARRAADEGLSGLEWMASLPGTVGGAVRGNAGCFSGETKDHLLRVTVLRDGEVIDMEFEALAFGYRCSVFKDEDNRDIILRAVFALEKDDPAIIKERMHFLLDKRKSAQPLATGTAGCTFKNVEVADDQERMRLEDETDIPHEMLASGRIAAGWLIDQQELKGMKIGGASISEEHANFIVNDGTATADDIVQLISLVKMKVRNAYGIQLEEEIQYIGF